LLLNIAAKFGHQMGIVHADPDDLCPFFIELRELGAQVGKLPLTVRSPISPVKDQGRLICFLQKRIEANRITLGIE
jgi:hypothetical protein